MLRKILPLILVVIFAGYASATYVGAAPGFVDIGEVERGETVEGSVYITTNYDNNFTLEPSFSEGRQSRMFGDFRDFQIAQQTSQKDVTGWFSFSEGIDINPNTTQTIELEDGSSVNAVSQFNYALEVPRDAEPGYHYSFLTLNAQIQPEGNGAATATFGETTVDLRFKVPGDPQRNIGVNDVRAFRLGEDQVAVELLLRNTGSVTVGTDRFETDVIGSDREQVTTLSVQSVELEPGESQWVEANWNSGDRIEGGRYQVDGEVDYLTGSATASGSFELPDYDVVEVQPEDDGAGEQGDGLPMWLVMMVLALLGVLMYSFEIDPFWILIIVGVLGISAFILMSGVPNYALAILLILVGVVIYSG